MRRILTIVLSSLLLAACGGDDGSSSKQDASKPKVDRAGYFTANESERINPKLADWNEAVSEYRANQDPCNEEAQKRFEQGATPAKAVECHLRDTKAVMVALDGVREVVQDLDDGSWRDSCNEGLDDFTEALVEQRAAFATLQADWVAYSKNRPTPKIDAHAKAASDATVEFEQEAAPALARACYTKADRDAAESGQDDTSG